MRMQLDGEGDQNGLPRRITPSVLWSGGCVALELEGELVHSHFGMYAIRGREKSLLIDTGHPLHAAEIEAALDNFLDGTELDYIFASHGEFPHFGLLPKWLKKYPASIAVGDVRDYGLYYPEYASRFRQVEAGDHIDLGDRKVLFIPAIWRDLQDTLWAFDTKDRVLFVADGFSITHHHKPGACGLLAGEQPIPTPRMIRLISELTLQWTKYMDPAETFDALDELVSVLRPQFIAPAHGPVIERPDRIMPLIKEGMNSAHCNSPVATMRRK